MSKTNLLSAATILGCAVVILAHSSGAQAATPKKAKAAPKTPAVRSLMCEGTSARVALSAILGQSRDESQVVFAAKLNPSASEALFMGVTGSTVLKAGRHVMKLTEDKLAYEVNVPFKDYDGSSDTLQMFIYPDGDFSAYSTFRSPRTAGMDMMCQMLGESLCSVSRVESRIEMRGVCWPAK